MGTVLLAILGWSFVVCYGVGSWQYNKWLRAVYLVENGDDPNRSRALLETFIWRFLSPVWPIAWIIAFRLHGRRG